MFDAAGFGIVADGRDVAEGIVRAIDAGQEVVLGKGTYLSSPIRISRSAHIHLEDGAVLKFIPEFSAYPPVFTRWEGVRCWCMHPCLFIEDAEGVTIDGEGTIDGSGEAWWEETARSSIASCLSSKYAYFSCIDCSVWGRTFDIWGKRAAASIPKCVIRFSSQRTW